MGINTCKAFFGTSKKWFFENFSATLDPIGMKLGVHTLLVRSNAIQENYLLCFLNFLYTPKNLGVKLFLGRSVVALADFLPST